MNEEEKEKEGKETPPDAEDPPFLVKVLLLGAVIGVVVLFIALVLPAMKNGVRGSTTIIEETENGDYKELFKR